MQAISNIYREGTGALLLVRIVIIVINGAAFKEGVGGGSISGGGASFQKNSIRLLSHFSPETRL